MVNAPTSSPEKPAVSHPQIFFLSDDGCWAIRFVWREYGKPRHYNKHGRCPCRRDPVPFLTDPTKYFIIRLDCTRRLTVSPEAIERPTAKPSVGIAPAPAHGRRNETVT
jgi:hypothetical protein